MKNFKSGLKFLLWFYFLALISKFMDVSSLLWIKGMILVGGVQVLVFFFAEKSSMKSRVVWLVSGVSLLLLSSYFIYIDD